MNRQDSAFPTFSRILRIPGWFVRHWRPIAAVALALAVAYSVTTAILGYRISRELARIKAEGAPVEMTDMAGPPVPDSENAALVYEKVFEKIKPVEESPTLNEFYHGGDPFRVSHDEKWWKSAYDLYDKHDSSFYPLIRQAQSMPYCRFKTNWEDGVGVRLPYLAQIRSLCRVLCLRGVVMGRQGRAEEAVSSISAAMKLRNAADSRSIIHALVSYAVVHWTTQAAAELARVGNLTDAQARQLDTTLASESLDQSLVQAMEGERAYSIWVYRTVRKRGVTALRWFSGDPDSGEGPPFFLVASASFRPSFYADFLTYLLMERDLIGISATPFRDAGPRMAQLDRKFARLPRFWLGAVISPVYGSAAKHRDRAIAEINATRTLIYLHRYKQRFGEFPDSLAQMETAPKWTAPPDPFSGGPLKYKRERSGYLLYSIGPNLKDEGGLDPSAVRPELPLDKGDIVWRE